MNKEQYEIQRKQLLSQAQKHIDEGKLEAFEAKKTEIEALDTKFEDEAKALSNFKAIYGDNHIAAKFEDHAVKLENGTVVATLNPTNNFNEKEVNSMKMKNAMEVKAFQNYIALGGDMRTMTEDMRNAVTTSGAGAVLPVDIFKRLITDGKYSDLLHRATIINQGAAGTVKIPLADSHSASWKAETDSVNPTNPTLTSIDLGGKELMRAIQYSAAVDSLAIDNFVDIIATLVSSETVETLERSFVSGNTANGEPHNGLQNLTWTPDTNAVITDTVDTDLTAADVAKGLSMMPQKYSRNAILIMNANTAYNTVGLFKGTSEYAYSMADGASTFMKKEIIINEHCADNEIYIVDPKELYVRFAMMPAVEVDKSSGFLSATTSMRCLTVVDYAWNTAACVKVAKKTA
jgi:HK97 family phage major capsid protein